MYCIFAKTIQLPTLSYSILYKLVHFQSGQCPLQLYYTNRFDSFKGKVCWGSWVVVKTTPSLRPHPFNSDRLMTQSCEYKESHLKGQLRRLATAYWKLILESWPQNILHTQDFRKGCNSQSLIHEVMEMLHWNVMDLPQSNNWNLVYAPRTGVPPVWSIPMY